MARRRFCDHLSHKQHGDAMPCCYRAIMPTGYSYGRKEVKHKRMTGKKQRVMVGAIAGVLGLGTALPAAAETEIEALRRELAEQKAMIRSILADQSAQKAAQSKAAATPAQAESKPAASASGIALMPNLTIYGILDGGFEHITNIKDTTNNTQGSVTRMPNITGTTPSRLGFNASKDIGPDLKAVATLEAGFNFDDGTLGQGGRIFGRQLFAGVDTKAGRFTFGRQYSMLVYGLGDADLLGPNIYSLGSFDAYLPNARFDNSAAWRAKFDKLSLGATYSTGRDTKGGAPASGTCAGEIAGTSQCKGWSAMLKYDDAAFGAALAVDHQYGGSGATAYFFNGAAPIAFSREQDTDHRVAANGYVKLGDGHKIGFGWLGRAVSAASGMVKSNAYYLEGSYKFSQTITIDGGYNRITNNEQDRDANILVLRGMYYFNNDFSTYLQVGHISNSAKAQYSISAGAGVSPAIGGSQIGTMVGLRYKF